MTLRTYLSICSVIGIIAIPGMMTGAILGGSSVQQAAMLQMVIMFMICAASALSCIITTVLALTITVDEEHRIRRDRIDAREHAIWRASHWMLSRLSHSVRMMFSRMTCRRGKSNGRAEDGDEGERQRLLG